MFLDSFALRSFLFSSRKPCDSYLKIDRSRRTLAKNDLPSSGADVWLSREMGFPYIYIYCISISRVFWRFLTFFARFWILSIFCALYPEKWSFFKETRHLSDIAIFGFRFFRSHSKRWDFRFYRFFDFWPFFTFFLSILFFGSFDFLSFFCHFLSILFLDGSCRMWHQSGDFFLSKNPKKSKKVEKMTKKGVKKKGSKLDLFVPPPFLVKNRVFCLANSPPSGYFSKIGPLTTVVFLYSPCSCRRGRSVWRQLFSPLFPGTLL